MGVKKGILIKKLMGRKWMAKSYGLDRIPDSPDGALFILVIDFNPYFSMYFI